MESKVNTTVVPLTVTPETGTDEPAEVTVNAEVDAAALPIASLKVRVSVWPSALTVLEANVLRTGPRVS
jgi:hypothetical protein